jgi:hypothetical protein
MEGLKQLVGIGTGLGLEGLGQVGDDCAEMWVVLAVGSQ